MLKFVLRLYALNRWLSSRIKNLATKRVRVGFFILIVTLLFRPTPVHAGLNFDSMLQWLANIAFSVAAAITRGIVLLINAMVPIITFNHFVDNPVVKNGWAIVRDTVNMFFVVVLIIIAFGTIFGIQRFKWQEQVPRLLIMAVVINFSKTLCGIMIDFGQVIMLTFANALREIAAGNFIQLLGLNQIYAASPNSSVLKGIETNTAEGANNAFNFFATGVISVVLVFWVFATLIILLAILLFRIVMLWVLVVIAPLAWFMKGAEGVIKSSAFDDWWKEFKCLVGIGPILAFFLWLTLAVAGAGNIAEQSHFDVTTGSNNSDFASSILELSNFLSFLIGMAMLFVGFKVATQFCSTEFSGKFAGKAVGVAKSIPAITGGLGLKAGSLGLKAGVRGTVAAGGLAKGAARRVLPASIVTAPRRASAAVRGATWGMIGKAGGSTFVGKWARGKQQDVAQATRARRFEEVNQEKEALKNKGRQWTQQRILDNLANPPSSAKGQAQDIALFEAMMADKRLQKDLGRDKVEALWKRHGAKYKDMAETDAEKMANITGFEKANADFAVSGMDMGQKAEWMRRNLKDADDANGLTAGAWGNKDVQDRAGQIKTNFEKERDKDGKIVYMNALEAARAGKYGVEAQGAVVRATDAAKLEMGSQMEEQFRAALEHNDPQSAQAVIDQIQAKYTGAGTTEQDRQGMALSMDRMRAAADRMSRGGNPQARDTLSMFDTTRAGMEATHGFGLPSAPKQGEGAQEYVDANFRGSSRARIEAAMGEMDKQKTEADNAVAVLDGELNALRGTEKDIADKQKQIEDIRRSISKSVEAVSQKAHRAVMDAQGRLDAARKPEEKKRAQEAVNKAQANFTAVTARGQEQIQSNDAIKSLEAEVGQIIERAGGQEWLNVVKEKQKEHEALKRQAQRLEEAKKKLEELRNSR